MRASGLLKQSRLDKDYTHEEISARTKISIKYLIALESEDQKNFPLEPYCSLMIKDYAEFLGLNGQNILKLFNRDFDNRYRHQNNNHLNNFAITPQFTFKIGIFLIVLIFSLYLFVEYQKFNHPPKLKITWPQKGTVSTQGSLDINGSTDPESTVRINQDLIIVDNQGNFYKKIKIENLQKITIESKSSSGKTTIVEKSITDIL